MYADRITQSMQKAINETNRRRAIQAEYNRVHGIVPQTIIKPVRDVIQAVKPAEDAAPINLIDTPRQQIPQMVEKLRKEMKEAAKNLEFEKAAELRDLIIELEKRK